MNRSELDKIFPETPSIFSERVNQTLQQIQEGKPMKKFALRTAVLTAAFILLLGGIAYAVINLGQEWYYNNRFTNYQTNHPEKHQAILDNLQKDPNQTSEGEANELISFQVLDTAWVAEQNVYTLSVSAASLHADKDELYPLGALDGDGYFDNQPNPDDPEVRTEHWLQTEKGFGLPEDVMLHPDKRLLLLDLWGDFFIGDSDFALPMWSSDQFTTEDGLVMGVFELNQERMSEPSIKTAIEKATNQEGFLPLRFPYKVWTLDKNKLSVLAKGEITFQISIK